MVDVLGHLGMALVWLAPVWFVVESRKTPLTIVCVGVWFGMLPDVDLYLPQVFGTIKHHGVVHTVLVVTLLALVLGPIVGRLLKRTLGGTAWFDADVAEHATAVGILVVWIPGLSHLFADILSAPDIADSIEPFWPLYRDSLGIDLIWYNDPVFNWGFVLLGLGLNAALYFWLADSKASSVPSG